MNLCDYERCTGCGACAAVCPGKCISMRGDEDGFERPFVNELSCTGCGLCRETCPVLNRQQTQTCKVAYALYHRDAAVRKQASSGGFIPALEEYVIGKEGFVFGVRYTRQFEAVHDYAISAKGCLAFRGSKYTQSKTGYTFRQAKKFLSEGKTVLYTGTPCQIAGLCASLGEVKTENLITVQLVCHGVPSPGVFRKYVDYLQEEYRHNMTFLNFRDKSRGWRRYRVSAAFGAEMYDKSRYQDLMMQAFLSDICLRESCYACGFKFPGQWGDFAVGDFWGIGRITDRFSDNTGVNICAVHSDKAGLILQELQNDKKIEMLQVDWKTGFGENPSAFYSAEKKKERAAFFQELNTVSFDKLVRRYCRPKWHMRLKRTVKNIVT